MCSSCHHKAAFVRFYLSRSGMKLASIPSCSIQNLSEIVVCANMI